MRKRAAEAEYLIRHKGRTFGPYARTRIEHAAREGKVTRRDLLRDERGGPWVPAWKFRWLRNARGRRLGSPNAPAWILVVAAVGLGGMGYGFWRFAQEPAAAPTPLPSATQSSGGEAVTHGGSAPPEVTVSGYEVIEPAPPPPPSLGVAARLAAHIEGEKSALPVRARLSARGSDSVHGAIVRYDWDLDRDGLFEVSTTRPEAPETVELREVGTHTFAVAVTDATGRRKEATTEVTVEGAPLRDPAARVAHLEALLAQERENRAWWLARIELRRRNGVNDPDLDARDRGMVQETIDPAISRLEAELQSLR